MLEWRARRHSAAARTFETEEDSVSRNISEFAEVMERRAGVARAYGSGAAAPLGRILARTSPATFFGPGGGVAQGADRVWSAHERGAGQFDPGGESHVEILHMAASDHIAYWVGIQHARVRMHGGADAIPMRLRVTEVLRRDGDEWMLIHRHADTLAASPQQ